MANYIESACDLLNSLNGDTATVTQSPTKPTVVKRSLELVTSDDIPSTSTRKRRRSSATKTTTSLVHCEVCDLYVCSIKSLNEHNTGKRHRAALKKSSILPKTNELPVGFEKVSKWLQVDVESRKQPSSSASSNRVVTNSEENLSESSSSSTTPTVAASAIDVMIETFGRLTQLSTAQQQNKSLAVTPPVATAVSNDSDDKTLSLMRTLYLSLLTGELNAFMDNEPDWVKKTDQLKASLSHECTLTDDHLLLLLDLQCRQLRHNSINSALNASSTSKASPIPVQPLITICQQLASLTHK